MLFDAIHAAAMTYPGAIVLTALAIGFLGAAAYQAFNS